MRKENCFLLGHISRKHGYKGEVIAALDTDRASDYENLESVFLEIQGELIPFFIESLARNSKGHFILQFEEIEDGDAASKFIGREIYLPIEVLPPLEGKKFYFHEVIDFEMIDQTLGSIGTCINVLDNASQNIFLIKHSSDKEILIPAVDEFILEIKRTEKQILLDCPVGLVELYLNA